jgi:hypothetical protein
VFWGRVRGDLILARRTQTLKRTLLPFALLMLGCVPGAWATILYDNTTTNTLDTVFYFSGPYTALGDQIQLISAGTATQAEVELFNNGDAGTFDVELDFYNVGSPVGALLGSFDLTDISSVGSDVIDLTFDLGAGLTVPEDLIFTVSVSNMSSDTMDLGVDMFEPPTVGSSDNTFMIAQSGGVFSQLGTNSENVYFQLSGTAIVSTPEASSLTLLGTGLLVLGIGARARHFDRTGTHNVKLCLWTANKPGKSSANS